MVFGLKSSTRTGDRCVATRRVQAILRAVLVVGLSCGVDRGYAGPSAEAPLVVTASAPVTPCVQAASRAYEASTRKHVTVTLDGLLHEGADALVASAVEMTRALESGTAIAGTEADVARIPWVLSVPAGNPARIKDLGDLGRARETVWVLAGPAAYEARRALRALAPGRVREAADVGTLRAASAALLPLSLAGPGDRVAVDVPPIVARAAVAQASRRPDAARAFVLFLTSDAGQKAFASCASAER